MSVYQDAAETYDALHALLDSTNTINACHDDTPWVHTEQPNPRYL